MSKHVFEQLAPFIQEYIYNHNWTELRSVQIAASEVIFNTDAHLLITAGTAAGKTEAAFLPVLTTLYNQPTTTIGAIYIGPIKALINDQFERLNDLVKEADIPIWHWHGDVSQNSKNKLLKNPQGILQITPESLEGLLIRKHHDLMRLFGGLRFVIIDEVHAFMGSERGAQILCQLARLANITQNHPRRIGLSATLGDYFLAEKWLSSGTEKRVTTPQINDEKRQVNLAIEHFYRDTVDDISDYEQYIFNLTKARKCLIFANNRSQTESIVTCLRQIAQTEGLPDIYHVHHGSISASLREAAENAMRGENSVVTAATLTLELGIDIGQLERVVQLEAPFSVASFLQRLGRSGRRGEPADMRFVCAEQLSTASLPTQFPWQLLQCIAIIQLYIEEHWLEPIQLIKYPLSLLYHQTMSILAAIGELSPAALAKQVLDLPPFAAITKEDYKQLLQYLLDINHLQQTESGTLIIGLAGEKIVNKFQFYAVFPDNQEYIVKNDSSEIGSILTPSPVGTQFGLAGRTWEVLEVNLKRKTVFVKQVSGNATSFWRGGSGSIHTRILQRMRQVLSEDVNYSYLQKNASSRLEQARQLAKQINIENNNIIQEEDACYLFPWMGTVAYRTLERLLNYCLIETLEIKSITGTSPYFLTIKLGKARKTQLYNEISSLCDRHITTQDLVATAEAPKIQKYDEYIPPALLRKAFATDYLAIDELKQCLKTW